MSHRRPHRSPRRRARTEVDGVAVASRNDAPAYGEFMMNATVPDSLHDYLTGAHEVALECFTGGCYQDCCTVSHKNN